MIIAGFIIICLNLLLLIYRYLYAAIHVQEIIMTLNIWYILASSFLPFIWWLYSTKSDEWHYYNRKKATLAMCITSASLSIGQTIWTFVFDTLVMKICKIPVGRNLDAPMIFILCRLALIGVTGCFIAFVIAICKKLYENVEIKEKIETVRWQYIFDTRSNKKTAFDLDYIKDLNTGKTRIIYEVDRFVHMFIVGASGTGKTSSTILKSIVCDLNKKIDNMLKRVPRLVNFVKAGKGEVFEDATGTVNEYSITPKKEYEDEFEQIKESAPDCGLTMMAPDNETMEYVIKLTEARNIQINVIDPVLEHTNKNVRMVGINPFYVELGLDYKARQIDIVNKAQNAAEVLLAVSEIHGVGDQYFRDINQSVTTSVSIVCMLHANLNGRQSNITEIQSCIADFGRLRPIVDDIQNKLHMHIKVHELATSDAKKGAKVVDRDSIKEADLDDLSVDDIVYDEAATDEDVPAEYKALGMNAEEYNKRIKDEGQGYAEPIHNVLMELLGAGAEFMFQQARGLRNILGNLLLNSAVRKTLAAPDDALLDFDKAFLKGEITVISTAQEISSISSTALGLFILLTMRQCTLRRPRKGRIDHFLYIDEASQYMHPMYEDMFALFRKYKVGVTMAVQSLSQFEKNATTKYLEGVLLGAGIHIVFGRVDPNTMKYYEILSGVVQKETIQTSVNSNSEFDDNYNVTSGKRKAVEEKASVQGSDIRIRGFQEVTVYMVKGGKVLKGFAAKTSFVPKKEYKEKSLPVFDFRKYAKDNPKLAKIKEISEGNEIAQKELSQFKAVQTVTNTQNEEERIETLPKFDAIEENASKQSPNIEKNPDDKPESKKVETKRKADTETIMRRKGDVSILRSTLDLKATYTQEPGKFDSSEIELLPATMLGMGVGGPAESKDIKVLKLEEAKRVLNKEDPRKKKEKKNPPKKETEEDIDFSKLLSSDPYGPYDDEDEYEGDARKLEDMLDDEEYLLAEQHRLNTETREE